MYLVTFCSYIYWFIHALCNQSNLVGSHHVNYASTFDHSICSNKYHVNFIHAICHGRVYQELHRNIKLGQLIG